MVYFGMVINEDSLPLTQIVRDCRISSSAIVVFLKMALHPENKALNAVTSLFSFMLLLYHRVGRWDNLANLKSYLNVRFTLNKIVSLIVSSLS